MKRFGLLGEKLGHSFSPQIHSLLGDYEYRLYERPPHEVREFLTRGEFDGLNVTIPYKKTAMQLCDTLSDIAGRTGSVNTIVRRGDGTLYGDNTDYFGFSFLLDRAGIETRGKKALILGNGGAAATVRAVLEDTGAGEIITVSRSGPDNYGNLDKHIDAYLMINTTPVGMYPGNYAAPVGLGVFPRCGAVLDLISNPLRTRLLLEAEDRGIPCRGGLDMLVAQAVKASGSFTGQEISDEKLISVIQEMNQNKTNIALIGMPGCGKSSVGKRLAGLTERRFYDVDEMIASDTGQSTADLISERGESAFRDIEEKILSSVSKENGCVIATGGGVVTRAVNEGYLRQNSVIVYLDRAPEELQVEGRPLSLEHGVEALLKQRLPLYEFWSDLKVKARGGIEETAQAVMDLLSRG